MSTLESVSLAGSPSAADVGRTVWVVAVGLTMLLIPILLVLLWDKVCVCCPKSKKEKPRENRRRRNTMVTDGGQGERSGYISQIHC